MSKRITLRGPLRKAPGGRSSRVAPGDFPPASNSGLRALLASRHERRAAVVLELDLDRCQLSFGATNAFGTCPASGEPCYQTFGTCKAKQAYQRSQYTWRFCGRGMTLPPGLPMRPYIEGRIASAPTVLDPTKGLAVRSVTTISMADEVCPDTEADPYISTRSSAAQGTFWKRLLARTKNAAGRFARLRRGYVVEPWSWDAFQTELYVIESVNGPDKSGSFTVQLSDAVRLLDKVQIPPATDGKLVADVKGISNTGIAQSGGASTIQLANAASADDGAYVGQEVFILTNTASGQRRVISAYVGSTRTATVSVAWLVNPDNTSGYEVCPLSLSVPAGKGLQYPDPAMTGKAEFVRLDDEVIRYTAKAGDVLSWTDGTYRAQFGTARADHNANAGVQLCRAWLDKSATEVGSDIFVEGGLPLQYVDVPALQAEDDNWLGNSARITTCLTEPTKASDLLTDFLQDMNLFVWWDPVAQLVKFKSNMPQLGGADAEVGDDELIANQSQAGRLDDERLTRAAIFYDPRSATANLKESKNFKRGAVYIDREAESPKEYGDVRGDVRYSRWLSEANINYSTALVARRLGRRRDAPQKLTYQIDPRDEVQIGALLDITTRQIVDESGAPKQVRMRVVKKKDNGTHIDLDTVTTNLGLRFGFIAPAGFPDYDAATEAQRQYAFIADSNGMTDGSSAYIIS